MPTISVYTNVYGKRIYFETPVGRLSTHTNTLALILVEEIQQQKFSKDSADRRSFSLDVSGSDKLIYSEIHF
jgi:hypothetical protein